MSSRPRRRLGDESPPYKWERIAMWILIAFCLGVEKSTDLLSAAVATATGSP